MHYVKAPDSFSDRHQIYQKNSCCHSKWPSLLSWQVKSPPFGSRPAAFFRIHQLFLISTSYPPSPSLTATKWANHPFSQTATMHWLVTILHVSRPDVEARSFLWNCTKLSVQVSNSDFKFCKFFNSSRTIKCILFPHQCLMFQQYFVYYQRHTAFSHIVILMPIWRISHIIIFGAIMY